MEGACSEIAARLTCDRLEIDRTRPGCTDSAAPAPAAPVLLHPPRLHRFCCTRPGCTDSAAPAPAAPVLLHPPDRTRPIARRSTEVCCAALACLSVPCAHALLRVGGGKRLLKLIKYLHDSPTLGASLHSVIPKAESLADERRGESTTDDHATDEVCAEPTSADVATEGEAGAAAREAGAAKEAGVAKEAGEKVVTSTEQVEGGAQSAVTAVTAVTQSKRQPSAADRPTTAHEDGGKCALSGYGAAAHAHLCAALLALEEANCAGIRPDWLAEEGGLAVVVAMLRASPGGALQGAALVWMQVTPCPCRMSTATHAHPHPSP